MIRLLFPDLYRSNGAHEKQHSIFRIPQEALTLGRTHADEMTPYCRAIITMIPLSIRGLDSVLFHYRNRSRSKSLVITRHLADRADQDLLATIQLQFSTIRATSNFIIPPKSLTLDGSVESAVCSNKKWCKTSINISNMCSVNVL